MTNEELKALSPLSQFYIAQAMRNDLQNNKLPDVADKVVDTVSNKPDGLQNTSKE